MQPSEIATLTWTQYLIIVLGSKELQDQEDEQSAEPVSGSEAMRRIRAARDSVTSH